MKITTRNLLVLSALLVILVFLLQGNVGLNLPDEGFLWYGTMRTALHEVPARDFQSYDPGRYYWGALWFKLLWDDGILALRVSQAAFQFVGLTLALLLLRRLLNSWVGLIFAAAILARWMVPTWKIYEPVIVIAAIYFAVLIIEQPARSRYLLAGVFTGLAAFFGRNHGLYCGVALLLLTVFLNWKVSKRVLLERLGLLSLGVVIGYAPMLLMFAFVPGFFGQFKQDLLFNLHSATNLPLPVPWPWRQTYAGVGAREAINRLTVGLLYVAFPVFYLLALARIFFKRAAPPVFLASALVGVMYLHYTFARPQLFYLAWTIPPFILGLLAVPALFSKQHSKAITVAVWSILALSTLGALELSRENLFNAKLKAFTKATLMRRYGGDFEQAMNAQGLVRAEINGDRVWIATDTARLIDSVKAINRNLIHRRDGLLVAPYYPGIYAVLAKRSPLWEIYFLLPRPIAEQQGMVRELESKGIDWALICHHYVDDRPELAFENTHSLLWQYLSTDFERVQTEETSNLDRDCELLRRK
jgi:hypothetical protein